ncbi:uncharacterized protein E0L32_010009 [Thyridium curvatum]|uniref:Major facilitator superfamily (MFS) profile domain-containing protein n=1 Tax=Thyridium curvatum TaxID=1093900 RepID=A0A507AHJ5_9PEZI|nr:uncharacterized protein E0L32_010009 [Thyridium curvatum]TPX08522.1 hypothetical protein E0L32_010009 [Thyridium curvatum]
MAEPKAPTATEVDFIQSQANEAQSNSMDSDGLKSGLAEQARNATGREHELTLKQAFRLYPKAIAFSLIFSAAVIMEGYDLALLGGFYGYSAFQNKFGDQPGPNGGKVVSANWQTYIQNGGLVGQIIGLYINGFISDHFGYKRTMLFSQALMISLIFIPFFAPNIQTILAGNILLGIPWGIFQTLSVTYASDVAPVILRPYLTTYVNLCWIIGQLISAGVLRGLLSREGEWGYRIPFALQWMWPPLIILGTLFAPESPWWLVRKGRLEDAKKALLQLTSRNAQSNFDVDDQVALMKATDELEKAQSEGMTYWDCFKGVDLRRTEIASVSYLAQCWCGSALMGYSVQFYERAGLSPQNSFDMNIGQSAMGVIGVLLSWVMMGRFGRRDIYIAGMFGLMVILMTVGGLGFARPDLPGPSWAIGSLLLFYTFVYNMTVGPVCYSIVAEIPSTRHKIKTVVLARNFSNIGGLLNNSLMPHMLGIHSWNWGARTGLFWAGFCVVILIWSYFRLPEPKGRTYGELDVLFHHRVSARKFASTRVDQFAEGGNTKVEPVDL